MRMVLIALLILLSSPVWATNWCDDANVAGCWLMESDGATAESDASSNGGDLTVSVGDTIPVSTTKEFGTYSRDFEQNNADFLYHADGGATDISGVNAQLSIVGWWRPESIGGPYEYLIAKYGSAGDIGYAIHISDGNDFGYRYSYNGTQFISDRTGNALSNSVFYHFALVSNDVTIVMYQDGVLDSDATQNHSGGLYDSTAPFSIGAIYGGGSAADGLIDDVAVFSRALDSTDINDIMDNGLYEYSAISHRIPTSMELRNITLRGVTIR